MSSVVGIHSFYSDLRIEFSKYLSVEDLASCARVCKMWKLIFDSDDFWQGHAHGLNIQKEQPKTFIKIIASKVLAKFPMIIKRNFQASFKQLVKERYDLEGWSEIRINYPPEFLKIFGSVQAISKIPKLEISENELGSQHEWCHSRITIHQSYFLQPLRFIIIETAFEKIPILLIRSRCEVTGTKFKDAIAFSSIHGKRFFSVVQADQGCSAFNPGNLKVTKEKMGWIAGIIQGKHVACNKTDHKYFSYEQAIILDSA